MKKSLIYSTLAALALLASGSLTIAINNATATDSDDDSFVALESDLSAPSLLDNLAPKDENVYVLTDAAGAASQIFLGSTLATNNDPLPITLNISYTLDGSDISAADLAGKSGHVKITYRYTAAKTYQNKLVPFAVATGLQLDGSKFKNLTLSNGKILSEGDSYTVLGYALAGLNENLNTDLLPDVFVIEADVTDFELGNSYSFATTDLIADLDTSRLSSADELISSINQLSSGFDQIITGSDSLDSGLDSLVAGVSTLSSGAEALNSGANALASGLSTLNTKVNSEFIPSLESLSTGLNTLSENSVALNSGVQSAFTDLTSNLQIIMNLPTTDATTKAYLSAIVNSLDSNLPTLYTKLGTYTGTVDYIAGQVSSMDTSELTNGISALSSGADQLLAGTIELKTGVDALASGASQLSTGSKALNFGLKTFKSSGLDRLSSFANNDLASLTSNLRASVSAAKSYHSYSNPAAKTVKFIFKTPSIK